MKHCKDLGRKGPLCKVPHSYTAGTSTRQPIQAQHHTHTRTQFHMRQGRCARYTSVDNAHCARCAISTVRHPLDGERDNPRHRSVAEEHGLRGRGVWPIPVTWRFHSIVVTAPTDCPCTSGVSCCRETSAWMVCSSLWEDYNEPRQSTLHCMEY